MRLIDRGTRAAAVLVTLAALCAADAPRRTTLVVGSPVGPMPDLLGVNGGPEFQPRGESVPVDAAALYAAFGVTEVRTHDMRAESLCALYLRDTLVDDNARGAALDASACKVESQAKPPPRGERPTPPHYTWTADETGIDDPANYDFTALDRSLAAIDRAHARVFLRLGENWNGPTDTTTPDAWTKVAIHRLEHQMGTFGPPPPASPPIAAVEVFNEPDGRFWAGERRTFTRLFDRTVTRARDLVEVPVGGPGFTFKVVDRIDDAEGFTSWFFDGGARVASLDFVSAHYYGQCEATRIGDLRDWLSTVRRDFEARAPGKPLVVSEWNIGVGARCPQTMYASDRMDSFVGGALVLLADAGVTHAHYYAGFGLMGMFGYRDGAATVRPSAWAWWAGHALLGGQRLAVGGSSAEGVLAIAADDGAAVRISLSNDQEAAYDVILEGLAPGAKATVAIPPEGEIAVAMIPSAGGREVDPAAVQAALAQVRTEEIAVDGAGRLALTLPARSLRLITVPRP